MVNECKTLEQVERILFDKDLKVRNLERCGQVILITGSDKDWNIVETWDNVGRDKYEKREER